LESENPLEQLDFSVELLQYDRKDLKSKFQVFISSIRPFSPFLESNNMKSEPFNFLDPTLLLPPVQILFLKIKMKSLNFDYLIPHFHQSYVCAFLKGLLGFHADLS
jgi:hypothetical protein